MFNTILCLIIILSGTISARENKYVKISLGTKWKQTPLALEASEYIAAKSNEKFWQFLESMLENPGKTEKDIYDYALAKAALLLSETEVDVLKFSLSLRVYSPRVKLFEQIAANLQPKCNIFYQGNDGSISCRLDEIFEKNKKSKINRASSLLHTFDHVHPSSKDDSPLVIVYASFISKDFAAVHKTMLSHMQDNNVKYVIRHYYQATTDDSKVALSGYGVELAVKSTEYKNVDDQKVKDLKNKEGKSDSSGEVDEVEGFLFNRLRELHPTLKDDLDHFKHHLKESNKELAPLRAWQLQDLSFQAAQRIISSSSQDVLQVLKDISQNVPMVARSLSKATVNSDVRQEITDNQQEFEKNSIAPGQTSLYLNGIEFSADDLDVFKLLNTIKDETNTMSELGQLDLEMGKTGELMALNVKPDQDSFIVDTRSESIQWINDLENDQQYNYWPSQLQEILRPTFPGMLRYIAKNIFHVVAYIDPLSKEGISMYKSFNEMISNSIPARFGVVLVADGSPKDEAETNAGAAITRAFSFIKSDKGLQDAFRFLTALYRKDGIPTSEDIIGLFTSWYDKSEAEESLGADSEYDDLRRVSKLVFDGIGLKSLPQVLVNGQQLSKDDLENMESSVAEKILAQTTAIQQAVYMGTHYSYPTIYDYIMSQSNVVTRLNHLIQTVKGVYVNMASIDGEFSGDVTTLSKEQAASVLSETVKYFMNEKGGTTVWVVADAQTEDGKKLVANALHYVLKQKNARLGVVLHGGETSEQNVNDILQTVFGLREKLISGVAKFVIKLLESGEDILSLVKNEDGVTKLANGITGINKKKLAELLSSAEALKESKAVVKRNTELVQKAFSITQKENVVFANGRVLGPLKGDDIFVSDDFELLQTFENNRCGYKLSELVEGMTLPRLPSEGHDRYKSDLVMRIAAILSQREDRSRTVLSYKNNKHSVIHIPPRSTSVSFDIEAVLDPLSTGAQKVVPILMALQEAFNVNLKIFLNCKAKHSELPVNRFYQFVIQSKLTFDAQGSLVDDQSAIFKNLPHSALLTLIMDTPQSWMIEAVGSNQDLDNINLGQATGEVYGDFELEHIIIEGHCSEVDTHQPPRGLQFIIGTEADAEMFDTIVMANLGYFQLKAFPGSFVLQLRDGRSSDIYEIDSLEGGRELNAGQNYTVVIDDFSGRFLKVKVKRRAGQENADLLGGDGGSEESEFGGIWDSIASYVKKEKSTKNTDGKIHIFSVATGLLYERFLRIMMLSVLNHTKTPVKFWFLKNYLSSGFTKFLPHYAEVYGFEYELVQYQWPRWLNGQTEKQRIIWGYKILFLDVLFPLNLERIIFVDADQIVRADLKELMEMDLEGAPYAYTPFCNDRTEVEGFRFWNHGYWRNHLAGRPYHISALYVVDLKRFRRVAAGDRLRGQYQGLSQDPNSLSNLDQDLPNNMIHQVQIKSLPQEWLWCETWCSDESKKYAKTIDMCNNPQTKEPKLERAIRIAPEWTVYDDIIRKLQEDISSGNKQKLEKTLPIKVEL